MATYYRLYVSTFETSNGIMVYGGKRHSHYEDSKADSYFGSGTIVKRAKQKYGRKCLVDITWSKPFESPALLKEAEALLVSELLESFDNCANLHPTGGGGPEGYSCPEDSPAFGKKRTAESRKRMSDAAKQREWSEEGLKRRKESTARMWIDFKDRHPDFSDDKNPAARKIITGDLEFCTGRKCAEYYSITPAAVIYRCKSTAEKWKLWNYA